MDGERPFSDVLIEEKERSIIIEQISQFHSTHKVHALVNNLIVIYKNMCLQLQSLEKKFQGLTQDVYNIKTIKRDSHRQYLDQLNKVVLRSDEFHMEFFYDDDDLQHEEESRINLERLVDQNDLTIVSLFFQHRMQLERVGKILSETQQITKSSDDTV